MKKRFFRQAAILSSGLFLGGITDSTFAFQAVWNKNFGSNNLLQAASGREVVVYNDTRVAFTGVFQESINFGLGLHTAQGAQTIFLSMFDMNGTPLWSRSFDAIAEKCTSETGCFGNADVQSAVFDQLGNVIIIAQANGSVDFGNGKISGDAYIAKFDFQGNALWSKAYRNVYFRGIAIDAKNGITLSGENFGDPTKGFANLGCGNVPVSNGGSDVLLAKLTDTGQCLWSKTFGGTYHDVGTRVAIEGEQNIVLAGNFDSPVINFGPILQTKLSNLAGSSQVYTAKFDSNGNHLWSKKFGTGTVTDLAGNEAKEIILTGDFSGSNLNFGNSPLSSNLGSVDIFLAKLDAQGNALWSKRYGSSANDHAASVATLGDKIYLTGSCVGIMSPTSLNCSYGAGQPDDLFLMKLDENGTYLKGRRFGDNTDQMGASIAVSFSQLPAYNLGNGEHIFVTGYFNNKLDLGISPILTSVGAEDSFLARFKAHDFLFPKWNFRFGPIDYRYTGCPIHYGQIVVPLEGEISENTFQLVEPARAGPITVNYEKQQLEYTPADDFVGVDQATFAVIDVHTGKISYVTFTIEIVEEKITE